MPSGTAFLPLPRLSATLGFAVQNTSVTQSLSRIWKTSGHPRPAGNWVYCNQRDWLVVFPPCGLPPASL